MHYSINNARFWESSCINKFIKSRVIFVDFFFRLLFEDKCWADLEIDSYIAHSVNINMLNTVF